MLLNTNKISAFKFFKYVLTKRNSQLYFLASRTILSDAYLCDDAWKKRLENPVLKNVKLDQYFVETDKKFGTKQLVSGIDIDLFANSIDDESHIDELEHLLYRFRRTKRAVEIMDSTTYATIRILLKLQQYETLLRILNDRENYGIFPDLYSYNILMSVFLKKKMYKEAANVAILMMLQENFKNRLSCLLGLHSCQTFLNECTLDSLKEEKEETTKEEAEDDDEVTLLRVPFIRNQWFDDHFEITNPKHLLGKTFYLIGRELDNPLGKSYQLVGLTLYEKWEKAYDLLKTFAESENTILSDVVEKVVQQIETIADDDAKSKENWSNKFSNLFKEMQNKGKIIEGSLIAALSDMLKDTSQLEKLDIEAQLKLFEEWEMQRKTAIDKQNRELDKQRRLKVIEEKKEYLYWKEKLLFFFENEEKNLEEFNKAQELTSALKEKSVTKDTYVPPEMIKKTPESLTKYQRLARVKKI